MSKKSVQGYCLSSLEGLAKIAIAVIASLCLVLLLVPLSSMKALADEGEVATQEEQGSEQASEAQDPSTSVEDQGEDGLATSEEDQGEDGLATSEEDQGEDGVMYAQAAGDYSRGTINAGTLPLNRSVTRAVQANDPVRYSITTTSNCTLRVKGTATDALRLRLYNSDGVSIANDNYYVNQVTGEATYDRTYYLNTGTFYVVFEHLWLNSTPMTYTFTANTGSTGVSFNEAAGGSDNTMASARSIKFDTSYKAQFSNDEYTYSYDEDYYKVTIADTCEILVSADTSNICGVEAEVYDSNGKSLQTFYGGFKDTTGKGSISGKTALLQPGTYYIKMEPYSSGAGGGVYDFKVRAVHTMYRLYNPNSGEHFYTESASERDAVRKAGWRYEGEGWTAPTSGAPVYRLYSGTDHHYTTSAAERDNLKKAGWKYEGIGWYSDDSKTVPLYRQFNPNVNPRAKKNNSGSHNYTTSKNENNSLVKAGWKAEGIGWYGC